MSKRDALFQIEAAGEARRRGRVLALAGLVLPAFAGTGGVGAAFPRLLPVAQVTGATIAVHGSPGEPTNDERQERIEQGISLDVPKGWSRSEGGDVVTFGGPSAGVRVRTVALPARAGGLDALRWGRAEVKHFGGSKAAKLKRVKEVNLPAGNALLLTFRTNPGSMGDPLSSVECSVYIFRRPGWLQVLSVWSPTASDNRALRSQVAESFRWK